MANAPRGAMSSPYNDGSLVEMFKRMHKSTDGTTGWGQYGDPPKKYTNLPASEAEARIRQDEIAEFEKQLKLRIDHEVSTRLASMKAENVFDDTELAVIGLELGKNLKINALSKEGIKAEFQGVKILVTKIK